MNQTVQYEVYPKENFYFAIKVLFSILFYSLLGYVLYRLNDISNPIMKVYANIILFYGSILLLIILIRMGLFVGYIKGNGIKITEKQFPEIYQSIVRQSQQLQLSKVPDAYLLQNGGVINAFAARFVGRNYVIIYSEVLALAYSKNPETLDFVVGHELGHVKCKHILKRMLLFPSVIIPFLNSAYSRACEYTCDRIGHALAPTGAQTGLLLLAAGRDLYNEVNAKEFMLQQNREDGFWNWFAEKLSSHPHLTKRVAQFPEVELADPRKVVKPIESTDHSKYLPV